jgi:hypothetical protein
MGGGGGGGGEGRASAQRRGKQTRVGGAGNGRRENKGGEVETEGREKTMQGKDETERWWGWEAGSTHTFQLLSLLQQSASPLLPSMTRPLSSLSPLI